MISNNKSVTDLSLFIDILPENAHNGQRLNNVLLLWLPAASVEEKKKVLNPIYNLAFIIIKLLHLSYLYFG